MSVLASDRFSVADAVGGVRGLMESVAPGMVFVVVFVVTRDLSTTLIASISVAVVAVLARLVQRTPVAPALGGFFGVAIGVLWAWRSGDAEDYFALGLWTNALYAAGLVLSVVIRWPAVGVVVEGLRSGIFDALAESSKDTAEPDTGEAQGAEVSAREGADPEPPARGAFATWAQWRQDRPLVRRYMIATWLWVGMFALRLAVQLPLYVTEAVGWLGTARLVMGIPLFALTLWITWLIVRVDREPAEVAED